MPLYQGRPRGPGPVPLPSDVHGGRVHAPGRVRVGGMSSRAVRCMLCIHVGRMVRCAMHLASCRFFTRSDARCRRRASKKGTSLVFWHGQFMTVTQVCVPDPLMGRLDWDSMSDIQHTRRGRSTEDTVLFFSCLYLVSS